MTIMNSNVKMESHHKTKNWNEFLTLKSGIFYQLHMFLSQTANQLCETSYRMLITIINAN